MSVKLAAAHIDEREKAVTLSYEFEGMEEIECQTIIPNT